MKRDPWNSSDDLKQTKDYIEHKGNSLHIKVVTNIIIEEMVWRKADAVFADTSEDFASIEAIASRFEEWKTKFTLSYKVGGISGYLVK